MGTRLWQYGANQQVFHCLFFPTFARCLSILVESPFLHKGFASSNPRPEASAALAYMAEVAYAAGPALQGPRALGQNNKMCAA